MDEFAKSLNVSPKFVYAVIALLVIAVVYQINAKAGTILGLLAITAILTN